MLTANLVDPLVEWRSRINWFGSDRLTAVLMEFLSGKPVLSRDGEVELSHVTRLTKPFTLTVTLRLPDAPYVADLVLRPMTGHENVPGLEGRSALPCPDRWRRVQADKSVRWELFNCMIYTLTSRSNQP